MAESFAPRGARFVKLAAIVLAVGLILWWFLEYRDTWPRGEALTDALAPIISEKGTDRSVVAQAIATNYRETRANAARWSGIYWGFIFAAAACSALAGLILKLESFPIDEKRKKDVAAILAVCGALLITIATSGDFQRKWQANRVAAAELERTGYELLEKGATDVSPFFAAVGQTLHRRQMAIVGSAEGDSARSPTAPAAPSR